MKNYNSIPERVRRRKEFDDNYSSSYCNQELNKLLTTLNGTPNWETIYNEYASKDAQAEHFFKAQVAYYRLYLLESYICKNLLVEDYCNKPLELQEYLQDSVRQGIYNEKLSSSDIYDLLERILPSYAEYVISTIECNSVDLVEGMIHAFVEHNKNEFIKLYKDADVDKQHFIHLCTLIQYTDSQTHISIIADTIRSLSTNMNLIDKLSIDTDTLEGSTILMYKELQVAANFNKLYEENLNKMKIQYMDLVTQLTDLEDCFDTDQYEELQKLMQDPILYPWYEETVEKKKERQEQIKDNSSPQDADYPFILPKDFWENSTYIDPSVPDQIKGLKVTELREQGVESFVQFVQELSNRGYIGRDVESQYKFVRAFTGRVPQSDMRGTQFEKSVWKGELGDLLYTIKTFTYQERDKYSSIPTLFELRDSVRDKLEDIMQSSNPASYAKAKKDYSLVLEQLYKFVNNRH